MVFKITIKISVIEITGRNAPFSSPTQIERKDEEKDEFKNIVYNETVTTVLMTL